MINVKKIADWLCVGIRGNSNKFYGRHDFIDFYSCDGFLYVAVLTDEKIVELDEILWVILITGQNASLVEGWIDSFITSGTVSGNSAGSLSDKNTDTNNAATKTEGGNGNDGKGSEPVIQTGYASPFAFLAALGLCGVMLAAASVIEGKKSGKSSLWRMRVIRICFMAQAGIK